MSSLLDLRRIDPGAFRARWRRWYDDAPPLGWVMHKHHPQRWMRIHSLPESKRYPETAEERAELLRRHYAVIEALLGDEPCALIAYEEHGAHRMARTHPLSAWLPDASPVMRIPPDDDGLEPISVFAGRIAWKPGAMDDALLAVADDKLWLALLNWETGAAYTPYDGGADLFWPSTEARDQARERFSAWLSQDPSGL